MATLLPSPMTSPMSPSATTAQFPVFSRCMSYFQVSYLTHPIEHEVIVEGVWLKGRPSAMCGISARPRGTRAAGNNAVLPARGAAHQAEPHRWRTGTSHQRLHIMEKAPLNSHSTY